MPRYSYNLPRLKPSGLPDATASGGWIPVESLDVLANSLELGDQNLHRDDIKSIPDPWAQLLVFERALFDKEHPLHAAVTVQWRALLATIALQPEFEAAYTLSTEKHDLSASENRSVFSRTLLSLKPERTLLASADDLDWRHSTTLRLHHKRGGGMFDLGEGAPIGFLTPTSLVAAGRGAQLVRCAGVPWLEDGFRDPIATPLSERHFRILAGFLGKLWVSLKDRPNLDLELRRNLAEALREFSDACDARAGERPHSLTDAAVQMDWPSALHRETLGSTQQYLSHGVDSDAELKVTGPITELFEGVILVDPDLAKTLGKGPESIAIWRNHTLAAALQPAVFDMIRQQADAAGWLLVRPEDLFTETLISFDGQTVNEAHPANFQSALLPISPLGLMLAPDAGLADRVDMTPTATSARVKLRLKLASGQEHDVQCDIPRALQSDETLIPPDDLAFWPNFRSPDWKWNFLHYTAVFGAHLRPRFALTADFIASQIKGEATDKSDRARLMRRWADSSKLAIDGLFGGPGEGAREPAGRISQVKGEKGEILLERIAIQATDTAVNELHHLPGGADAIFFSRRTAAGVDVPAGLALIKFDRVDGAATRATVAVDFGTTNTVVYSQLPGQQPAPVAFSERVVFPFVVRSKSGERRENLAMLYLDYFPLRSHATPLPTVAKLREFRPALPRAQADQIAAGNVDQHGFADNILFVPNFEGFVKLQAKLGLSENIFMDLTQKGLLKFRLKWGKTKPERALARRFLRQIMMMSAAELMAEGVSPSHIEWRFSYPQAFRARARDDLEQILAAARTQLFGPPVNIDGVEAKPLLRKTEGEAAAHYFMERAPENLMLMLDIGGGTTDVALWRGGKPFWRNSFRIAGGDFFTAYLANNPDVLANIKMDEVASGLKDGAKLNGESRRDFVELYVNKPSFSEQFSGGFALMSAEPGGRGLQLAASVALGGLLYYVGLLLTRFLPKRDGAEEGADEGGLRLSEEEFRRITIAFAGRGSTIFGHMHGRGGDSDLARLTRLLVAATGRDPVATKIEIRFSAANEAKHEVAKGLLSDRDSLGDAKESRLAILGEDIFLAQARTDKNLEAVADLNAVHAGDEIKAIDLVHLKRFLIALRRETEIDIDAEGRGGLDDIRKEVRQDLMDAVRDLDDSSFSNPDTQPFDPPFIMALRRLVEMMASSLDQRDQVLDVGDD